MGHYVVGPGNLLSYAFSDGPPKSFARKRIRDIKGQYPGLVYALDVAMEDLIAVESPQFCGQYLREEEALVMHGEPVEIHAADLWMESVDVAPF